jgi:hypothetical protein
MRRETENNEGATKNLLLNFLCVIISLTSAFGVAEKAVRIFTPQEVTPIRFRFDPGLDNFSQLSMGLTVVI